MKLWMLAMVMMVAACGDDDGVGKLPDAPRAIDAPLDPDNDGDGFKASMDCDDNNAAVHPGATEVCNDIDDNCQDGVDEGTATFDAGGDGVDIVDVSAAVTGTMTAPAMYTPPAAGVLRFCGASTYYVRIDAAETQLEIAGKDRATTILDGAGAGTVVSTAGALNIHDVTLARGKAIEGGGLHCLGGSLAMKNCILVDNEAQIGGGMLTDNCSTTVEDTVIEDNRSSIAGAGYANRSNVALLTRVTMRGNMGRSGGALSNQRAGGRVEIVDSEITGNFSAADTPLGGGIYTELHVSCTNSAITSNTGYGVHIAGGTATYSSTACDYGTDATTDNTPHDVFPSNGTAGSERDFGNDATFTCTNIICQDPAKRR